MSYDPTPTTIKGGQEEAWVVDQEARMQLSEILLQMKIMNEYLSILCSEKLTELDITKG